MSWRIPRNLPRIVGLRRQSSTTWREAKGNSRKSHGGACGSLLWRQGAGGQTARQRVQGRPRLETGFKGVGEIVRTEAEPHRAYIEGHLLTTVLSFLIGSNFPDHQTTVMEGSTTRHRMKAHTNGCNLDEGIHSIRKQNSNARQHG